MSDQILIFLIDTIIGLFSLALLMRFYFQLLRVPYYNPLSRFLIAVT
nr:YggT family protein [Nitrosomonas sp.]